MEHKFLERHSQAFVFYLSIPFTTEQMSGGQTAILFMREERGREGKVGSWAWCTTHGSLLPPTVLTTAYTQNLAQVSRKEALIPPSKQTETELPPQHRGIYPVGWTAQAPWSLDSSSGCMFHYYLLIYFLSILFPPHSPVPFPEGGLCSFGE